MTERTLSLSEAYEQFLIFSQKFAREPETIHVIHNGEQVMTILPSDKYKELQETIEELSKTLEIVHDEKFMTSFRLAERGLRKENLFSLTELKKELGWEEE